MSGWTDLHRASWRGDLDTVKTLIQQGSDVNCADVIFGLTPLHLAYQRGHLDTVKILIQQGSDVNCTDKYGRTPLHLACREGHLDVVSYLCSQGSNPETADKYGETPLHYACSLGHLDVGSYLCSQGSNPQAADNDGRTPLHYACRWGHTEVIKYLLRERHCDPNIVDRSGQTPLALSRHPAIVQELFRHGAHASDVYKLYGKKLPKGCPKKPTESAVKVFIVGKQGMGKTTLTTALNKEGGVVTYVAKRLRQVSGVEKNTVGVIPHDVYSKKFGYAIIYDMAGHEEFYSGHDVMLRSSIAGSPAVFLLVANLCLNDRMFKQSILSWLAFLENQGIPEDPKPHVIIVGSHADQVKSVDVQSKDSVVTSIVKSSALSCFRFAGFIPMDCRYAESPSMTKLRQHLSESCSIMRHKAEISVNCHCLYIWLLDQFQNHPAIRVKEVLSKVQEESRKAQSGILNCIPDDPTHLCKLLQDLHERSRILILKDTEKLENSWLILDREAILSQVTGTVFAPNPDEFKQYKDIASSTGVVLFSKIESSFPDFDANFIAEFLCHFEFCHEISDAEGKQLLQVTTAPPSTDGTASEGAHAAKDAPTNAERFFFFPGLVKIDMPDDVWQPSSQYSYHSGWLLQSSHPDKFFTRRFLHVLLVRLAFAFALAPDADSNSSQLPTIQRKCSIWKNGIQWGDRSGTEALVLVEESRKVHVMVRCFKGQEMECIHLRSLLIRKVLDAKDQLCLRVPTSESFLHPEDATSHPLKLTADVSYTSCSEIAIAITKGKNFVLDQSNKVLNLETVMYFEPYAHLGEHILQEIFNEDNPNYHKIVSNDFFYRIADHVHEKNDQFSELFKLPTTLLQDRIRCAVQGPTHKLVEVFKLWRQRSEGSYQCLRGELDRFSVFAGRNPLTIAGCNVSEQPLTRATSTEAPHLHTQQWLPEEVDSTILDIKALCAVNGELLSVAPRWMDLGVSLGLDSPTLELINADHPKDARRCLTEVLAKWLQQIRRAPSWRTLVLALMSPLINKSDLARSIAMSHGLDLPRESDLKYQDVNSEQLDTSDIRDVLDAVSTLHEWFQLGLSLGLSYDRLRTIEVDNHHDTHRCRTEMLKAWLTKVGTGISWRGLACALDSPLVGKTDIASMIATQHRL